MQNEEPEQLEKKGYIKLNSKDMDKLKVLKNRFGYSKNPEMIRYLINVVIEDMFEKDTEKIMIKERFNAPIPKNPLSS
jgi:hypothetical protein